MSENHALAVAPSGGEEKKGLEFKSTFLDFGLTAEHPQDVSQSTTKQHENYYKEALGDIVPPEISNLIAQYITDNRLEKGDFADAYDRLVQRWYTVLILDEKQPSVAGQPELSVLSPPGRDGRTAFFSTPAANAGERLFYVHYVGWSTRWREWLPENERYIQPYGWVTRGRVTVAPSTPTILIASQHVVGRYVINFMSCPPRDRTEEPPEVQEGRVQSVDWARARVATESFTGEIPNHPGKMWRTLMDHKDWTCPQCNTKHKQTLLICRNCGYSH